MCPSQQFPIFQEWIARCPRSVWFAYFVHVWCAEVPVLALSEQWAELEALQARGTHPSQHRISLSTFRRMCLVWHNGDDISSLSDGISEQHPPQTLQTVVQQSQPCTVAVLDEGTTLQKNRETHTGTRFLTHRACSPLPEKRPLSLIFHSLLCCSFNPCCG